MKQLSPGVVMSFDDHQFIEDWVETLELFERFSVHVTFMIHAPHQMTADHWKGLHSLANAGHAVGCHSLTHAKAIDYIAEHGSCDQWINDEVVPALDLLKKNGFNPRAFAYPCSQNNEETDTALSKFFNHARTGAFLSEERPRFADLDEIFKPVDQVNEHFLLPAKGIDKLEDLSMIDEAACRASKRGELLFLLGHRIGIEEPGKDNRILTNRNTLEEILKIITSYKLNFYTFDELP